MGGPIRARLADNELCGEMAHERLNRHGRRVAVPDNQNKGDDKGVIQRLHVAPRHRVQRLISKLLADMSVLHRKAGP